MDDNHRSKTLKNMKKSQITKYQKNNEKMINNVHLKLCYIISKQSLTPSRHGQVEFPTNRRIEFIAD